MFGSGAAPGVGRRGGCLQYEVRLLFTSDLIRKGDPERTLLKDELNSKFPFPDVVRAS